MIDFQTIKAKLRAYLSLNSDKIEDTEAIQTIISGTEFKGTSLWILICAIQIASLGLNMNSTAVIIGAMLISPLMGPIMGIGLGLGINDTSLIVRCLKNLAVATLFSLLASCLYFCLSPLNDARSELLARTQPTIYDVLIAFFGGFAGIIATGSRQKGNILPGVAIATALMPPLCTAGYGLATLQWNFLFGAFYLFLINCVYIGLATWLGCIVLKLPKVKVSQGNARYRTALTVGILLLVVAPSAITTIDLIRQEVRESHVSSFLSHEFGPLTRTQVMSHRYIVSDSVPVLEVVLVGETLEDHTIELKAARMQVYELPANCQLKVIQGSNGRETDVKQFSLDIIQNMSNNYQNQILRLQSQNDSLRNVISDLRQQIAAAAAATNDTIPKAD